MKPVVQSLVRPFSPTMGLVCFHPDQKYLYALLLGNVSAGRPIAVISESLVKLTPASIPRTEKRPFSDNLFIKIHPAAPPPTTIMSTFGQNRFLSLWLIGGFFCQIAFVKMSQENNKTKKFIALTKIQSSINDKPSLQPSIEHLVISSISENHNSKRIE